MQYYGSPSVRTAVTATSMMLTGATPPTCSWLTPLAWLVFSKANRKSTAAGKLDTAHTQVATLRRVHRT